MSDRIEKTAEFAVPVERLWRAITDHVQFGEWFRVVLEGPFVVGETARGRMLYPGYDHIVWEARITAMEAPRLFAFTWHPYAVDPNVDYSGEPPTLVAFQLEPTATGARLQITESGFDALPIGRRADAWRRNEGGWTQQIANIGAYVAA